MTTKIYGYAPKPNSIPECNQCGKIPEKVAKCGQCSLASYCNRECQTKHWPSHKKVCQLPKSITKPPVVAPSTFPAFTIEEGKIVCRQVELTAEMQVVQKRMSELIEFTSQSSTDLERLKRVLALIEFLMQNKDFLYLHFLYVSLILRTCLINIYKLSDELKCRQACFLPESGWWYLGQFSSLLYINKKIDNHDCLEFMLYMMPKILNEDLPSLKKALEQMHDLESPSTALKCALFKAQPELLTSIVALQQDIEKELQTSLSNSTNRMLDLEGLLNKNNLKVDLPHIRFSCKITNDFFSLKKIISLIDEIEKNHDLSNGFSVDAFLFFLMQIGEYISHKKISSNLRESYPGIPWDQFVKIRDCLVHPEENQRQTIIQKWLAGEYPEAALDSIKKDLLSLKIALKPILETGFKEPDRRFVLEYQWRYESPLVVQGVQLSLGEQAFFLANLQPTQTETVKFRTKWENILSGSEPLPLDRRELGELMKLFPKEAEAKKSMRTISDKLAEIRDQGYSLLSSSEKKEFEKTPLYKAAKNRWHRIIQGQLTPLVRELQELENLPAGKKLFHFAWSELEKIWMRKWGFTQVKTFLDILEKNPSLKWKWLKILNCEDEFPSHFFEDLKLISKTDHAEANVFIELVSTLKSISENVQGSLPAISALFALFNQEKELKEGSNKIELLKISISHLSQFVDFLSVIIFSNESSLIKMIRQSVSPISQAIQRDIQEEPKYRAFVIERQKIYDQIALQAELTGKALPIPITQINALYESMVGKDLDDSKPYHDEALQQGLKNVEDTAILELQENFESVIDKDLAHKPFLLYQLTVSLSLLKKIMKFDESTQCTFLRDNYFTFKRCRNSLVHDDYITRDESAQHQMRILKLLSQTVAYILKELKDLKEKISRSES